MKVMLVDDDRTMRSLLKTLLEIEKFDVVTFDDFRRGNILEQIRSEKPDVLIMDIFLRDMNGLDILRALRQDNDLAQIKVMMTSGTAMQEECASAGADAFLLKPYMPDDLLRLIRQVREPQQ